jgi:hypothetical protein
MIELNNTITLKFGKENNMENKYAPFSLEEWTVMKAEVEALGNYLPEHQLGIMWERCTRIRGQRENQPCMCKGSAGLWARCIENIRAFIKERE